MNKLVIVLLSLVCLSAKADFVTGLIVGSMLSSGSNKSTTTIKVDGKACMIYVKTSKGAVALNAAYFVQTEEIELESNIPDTCTKGIFFNSCTYKKVKGARIILADGNKFRTFTTQQELVESIKVNCLGAK